MNLKNKLKIVSTAFLMGVLTLGLAACTTPNEGSNGSGSGSGDPLADISGIIDDGLTFDSEGKPEFDEQIELNVWSIIGDPDKATQTKIFDRFNEEFAGLIHLNVTHVGHFDFYTNLENTWATEPESVPDVCFMHNEKTGEYAGKGYLWALDELFGEKTGVNLDFTQAYANIDRVTKYKGYRFAVPVDAHGFLTSFRQDIIKKNELGFENNTRFIPESRSEYQTLLEGLRSKADKGELWTRNINKGVDHSWYKVNASQFYPEWWQSTDPDGLSALYANGGSLANADETTITFGENEGFKTYLTDQVDRYNRKLMGEAGSSTEMFGAGTTVMFSEGPWYVSQSFTGLYNNTDLTRAGQLGVTAEDAADEIYSKPYIASHPKGWWTLDENIATENGNKWYGNGHAISITKQCTSLKKVAAALSFMEWYTQGVNYNDESQYNLTQWCTSGHIPAWKNIYESENYQEALADNMTLRALGNPEDIIAMESLQYESTIFAGIGNACTAVQTALKQGGCDNAKALSELAAVVESTQALLDMQNMMGAL